MRYNTKCTVWHKQPDGAFITQHYPCWWQDTEAENIAKTGKTDVDRALIHLPLLAVVDKSDYIAKGDIDFDVTASVAELLKAVSCHLSFFITSAFAAAKASFLPFWGWFCVAKSLPEDNESHKMLGLKDLSFNPNSFRAYIIPYFRP